MIIIHGLCGFSNNFRSIMKNEQISQKVNTYLMDLRNHGDSFKSESMKMSEMSEDIYNFI
jgi:esterase